MLGFCLLPTFQGGIDVRIYRGINSFTNARHRPVPSTSHALLWNIMPLMSRKYWFYHVVTQHFIFASARGKRVRLVMNKIVLCVVLCKHILSILIYCWNNIMLHILNTSRFWSTLTFNFYFLVFIHGEECHPQKAFIALG